MHGIVRLISSLLRPYRAITLELYWYSLLAPISKKALGLLSVEGILAVGSTIIAFTSPSFVNATGLKG